MKHFSLCLGVLLSLTFTSTAQAQKVVAIKAGRLLDPRTGTITNNAVIVVESGKIMAVGASVAIPANAEVIDLSRMTVLPGLMDCHTHLTYNLGTIGSNNISVPREALMGARNARLTLEAGFTTVRNVGANGYADVALRDAINAGDVVGPRVIASGPSLGITGGHCDNNSLAPEFLHKSEGVADGVAGVMQKTREVIKYGADVIKVCSTGGVLSLGDDPKASQYTLEELKTIVTEAHRLGRKVAAHAHGGEGIKFAVLAGVDSIEHGTYIDDETVKLMKERGTYLVPTVYLTEWFMENYKAFNLPPTIIAKAQDVMPAMRKNLARAFAQGVPVACGTDAAVYPHGLNGRELASYVKLGLTPLQALQSATINAAKLLGMEDKLGTLEAGKYADMIAIEGDPIKDITEVERVKVVIKGGVIFKK